MKNSFKFNYFGLTTIVLSGDVFFLSLMKKKFDLYLKKNTHQFDNRKISLTFSNVRKLPKYKLKKIISNDASTKKDKLIIKHDYLTTRSLVVTKFNNSDIINIKIFFQSSVLFNLINLFTNNFLKRQLFQNLIKLYIEQSLLWNLSTKFKLSCLHASAVEKNNRVIIFSGLNGIGKSTLSLFLTKRQGFNLFSDNYLLIDKKNAYFSPDIVRLSKESLKWLDFNPDNIFGFNKYTVNSKVLKISKTKIASIDSIYITSRGGKWSKKKLGKSLATDIISSLQISNSEDVRFSAVSQFRSQKSFLNVSMPSCNYFQLNLGNLKDLKYEF